MNNYCRTIRHQICDLIKNEEWDSIEYYRCLQENCVICNNRVVGEFPLLAIMNSCKEMNQTIEYTINRIYKDKGILSYQDNKLNSDGWFEVICATVPSFDKLSYFVNNKMIDPNCGSYKYTLLDLYAQYKVITTSTKFDSKYFDYILSPQVGCNINIQNACGESILLSIIREMSEDEDIYDTIEYINIYIDTINYLLEKGADPLLENKEGMCALEYSRNSDNLNMIGERKSEIISLLEYYS